MSKVQGKWPLVEIVLEPGERNWSASSPDVPGCVATGADPEETLAKFRSALEMHFEDLAVARPAARSSG